MLIKSQSEVRLHTGRSVHFHPSRCARPSFSIFRGSGSETSAARWSGPMPIPDLCILECVITGCYMLMNVIMRGHFQTIFKKNRVIMTLGGHEANSSMNLFEPSFLLIGLELVSTRSYTSCRCKRHFGYKLKKELAW